MHSGEAKIIGKLLLGVLALAPVAAQAAPRPVVAVSAERASGFASLEECRRALGPAQRVDGKLVRGAAVNRAHGNRSRCEMVSGEPSIVVYPRGA